MLGFGLLPLLAFGLLALVPMLDTSPDDEDTPLDETPDPVEDDETAEDEMPDDEMPDDEMEVDGEDEADPVDPATLGATFEETEEGINIQFGENETGRLAVFTYTDYEVQADDFLDTHEARYYLVPEGVEWADNTSETSMNIPGTTAGVEAFEEFFDLTLLGTVDLLAQGNDSPTTRDMADALPDLTTNAEEVDYYYLQANTDGDDLITFLQEGWLLTRNGVTETVVTEDTVGTDEVEWFTTATEGVTLDGDAGDDTLISEATGVTLFGGEGGDTLTAAQGEASIFGGVGDDIIDIVVANTRINVAEGDDNIASATVDAGDGDDDVTVHLGAGPSEIRLGEGDDSLLIQSTDGAIGYGEAGDDRLSTNARDASTPYGGEGNDGLQAVRAGNSESASELFGGEGDNWLSVGSGAQAFGGVGNDNLQVQAGGIANGGTGDDTIGVSDFYGSEEGAATVTGGEGSDVFNIGIRSAFGEANDPIFAEITDFNVAEDMLMVDRAFSGPEVDRIEVVEDPDGAFTDVEVFFGPFRSFPDGTSTIVRLTGVTGLPADAVVIGRP